MKWPDILDRYSHRYATVEDVRKIFADYHDALHWLAVFLIGDNLAPACVIDACNIAERQGPVFHEWLAHWAARATLRCALQMQRTDVAELAPSYERFERVHARRSPLSPKDLQFLSQNRMFCRLDSTSFVASCSPCTALPRNPARKLPRSSGSARAPSSEHIALHLTRSTSCRKGMLRNADLG